MGFCGDGPAACRVRQLSYPWAAAAAYATCGFHRIVRPRLLGLPPDEAAIAEAMPRGHAVIAELSRFLGGSGCFAGAEVSLAEPTR